MYSILIYYTKICENNQGGKWENLLKFLFWVIWQSFSPHYFKFEYLNNSIIPQADLIINTDHTKTYVDY